MRMVVGSFVVALVLTLVGCGTARPVGQNSNKFPADYGDAGIRLTDASVVWKNNPGFIYDTKAFVRKDDVKRGMPANISDRSKQYIRELHDVFQQRAATMLKEELARRAIASGKMFVIELTPLHGYYDDSGWGNGIVVRATIVDAQSKAIWHTDIDSRSGLHWIGGIAAPTPDESFVKGFVSSLIDVFRYSNIIPL